MVKNSGKFKSCTRCGKQVVREYEFCPYCGYGFQGRKSSSKPMERGGS